MQRFPRLRELSPALRLGLTGILLTLAGGFAAGAAQIVLHHAPKDEEPGLSLTDLMGSYHGVRQPARLRTAIEGEHGKAYLADASERATLLAWLSGGRLSEEYDSLERSADSPAEILEGNCLRCHARKAKEGGGIGTTLPLEFWDDVKKVAFAQELDPVPLDILVVTTHTHGLSLPLVTLLAAGLFLLTRWPRRVRHGVFLAAGLGLFLDLGGWWLARETSAGVFLILGAGAVYGTAMAGALFGTLADLWLPRP